MKVLIASFCRWSLISLCLPLLSLQAQLSIPLYTCYDVNEYELEIKINAETQRIAGTCRMAFEMKRSSDLLQFDLAESLTIARIELGSRTLRYDRSGTIVTVRLPYTMTERDRHSLKIVYGGHPHSENLNRIFSQDGQNQTQIQFKQDLIAPEAWRPLKQSVVDPVDSMRLGVIYEKGPLIITNGRQRFQVSEPGGFQKSVYVTVGPVLPGSLELHIGYFEKLTDIYGSDFGYQELNYFVPAGQNEWGKERLIQIQQIFSCMESYFGSFPLKPSGMTWVDTGGAYAQEGLDKYGVDPLLAYELAGLWWGNHLQATLAEDAWITESFRTYASSLVIECRSDTRKALSYLQQLPEEQKSAMILHTLRSLTDNEEQWFGACRAISSTFEDRSLTTEALLDFFQWKIDVDATHIFQQYLLHPSPPVLEYSILSKGKKLSLAYRWNTSFVDFDMPVDIFLRNTRERIVPTTEWKTQSWKGVSAKHFEIDRSFGWFRVQELQL
ncbi:MAG: hypothetical protein AAF587_05555 [Bacteroidota bacterium]